jgi:hypothetical protein
MTDRGTITGKDDYREQGIGLPHPPAPLKHLELGSSFAPKEARAVGA